MNSVISKQFLEEWIKSSGAVSTDINNVIPDNFHTKNQHFSVTTRHGKEVVVLIPSLVRGPKNVTMDEFKKMVNAAKIHEKSTEVLSKDVYFISDAPLGSKIYAKYPGVRHLPAHMFRHNPLTAKFMPKFEVTESVSNTVDFTPGNPPVNDPIILYSDVVAVWLGLEPGDRVKIHRYDSVGEYITYRTCRI